MIFKNVEHALKWSFQVSGTDIVKMSGINSMRGASGSGELTPHDRHAQAALIIGMTERVLDVNQMAWILAKFSTLLMDDGQQKRAVMNQLTQVVIASLPTGVHSRRGYEKLILCYFSIGVGVHAIRKDLKCGLADVPRYREAAYDALDAVWNRAYPILDAEMVASGLVCAATEAA